ncbi:lipoate-protein ligase A [Krasilnikovia cinnamomea]|uniref:Lipoate-protein ligase A n=1 Tax=Krasilnikovia cinnamomea TaxID=349313 RepID=A0A4Q7ZDF9_9ACTN|nr:lipoate--protein ligase family protein [Krasilnikovia cinnamomea]RZU48710.1 lipoate-protein ligase A [Krasilnikovia cinnamomea]
MTAVLLDEELAGGPAHDVALGPLLLRRGLGEARDILRVYSPEPTAAFSRRDTLRPGYPGAAEAVHRLGFAPVVRPQGGSLAAYHRGSVVVDHVCRAEQASPEPVERFQRFAALHAALLVRLGVDARIGPVAGEYCPGEYSINAGGMKIVGSAQRVTRDGWLFSTVIQVAGSDRLREVLTAAYRELGYDFEPATVGAVEDVVPGVTVPVVTAAVRAAYDLTGPAVNVPAVLTAELS